MQTAWYNRCPIGGNYFIVIGVSMMREGAFVGGLDVMFLKGRVGVWRDGESRSCPLEILGCVYPLLTKASMGLIETNFHLSSFNFDCH